tara:strand:+ start:5993 stop:6283 length:291 start_codon:yes stop_codon:yes gene_type:complete
MAELHPDNINEFESENDAEISINMRPTAVYIELVEDSGGCAFQVFAGDSAPPQIKATAAGLLHILSTDFPRIEKAIKEYIKEVETADKDQSSTQSK